MGTLKGQPVGRNWQYRLGEQITLLRNVGSVEAEHDGWILWDRVGSCHVSAETALDLLLGLRRRQLKARDPVNLACAPAYWVDMRGNEHEVRCGSWHGERNLCDGCTARAERAYPQGWRYDPGDVCRHGVYVRTDYDCASWQCEAE